MKSEYLTQFLTQAKMTSGDITLRNIILTLGLTVLIACSTPHGNTSHIDATNPAEQAHDVAEGIIRGAAISENTRETRIAQNTEAFLPALSRNRTATAYDRISKTIQTNDGRIRISILLPLESNEPDLRTTSKALLNAAQLALFDLDRPELTLLIHDTDGTPAGAKKAARKALQDGTQIIIGPLFAHNTKAIIPLTRKAGVPVLSFSNNRDIAGKGLWLIGFLPEQNLDRIISETIAQDMTRFAALIPETPYGQRIEATLKSTIESYGGELVQVETYQENVQSMLLPAQRIAQFEERKLAWEEERARLTEEASILLSTLPETANTATTTPEKIWEQIADINPDLKAQYNAMQLTETFGDLPYDAVIMPEGGIKLRSLAPLLPYFDVDPRKIKFLGTGLWDDPVLGQEPPLVGGWYAAPEPAGWRKFKARYEKIYGNHPPRLASLAYDSIGLIAALTNIHPDNPFTHQRLTNPNGFLGIDGIFRLTDEGLNERGLAVLEIKRKNNRKISRAPKNFINRDQTPQ